MSVPQPELHVAVFGEDVPTVKHTGQVDYHNRDRVTAAFESCLNSGKSTIRADLTGLHYIDSSGLSVLVQCALKAKECGGIIEITGISAQASRVITMCGAALLFRSGTEGFLTGVDLPHSLPNTGFWHVSNFSIPASPGAVAIARGKVANVVKSLPFNQVETYDILTAVGEALTNAIRHGCGCDAERRVFVRCVAMPFRLVIDITDQGCGFCPEAVPDPVPNSLLEGGMGIYMMRHLMDEVSFDFTGCTKVRLVKKMNEAIARNNAEDGLEITEE